RERLHPFDPRGDFLLVAGKRLKRFRDLGAVPCRVEPQAFPLFVASVVGDEVVFVIAHHREGQPRVHETANELEDSPALRTAVDKVSDKDQLAAFGVLEKSTVLAVAQLCEEKMEGLQLPVNVPDKVPVLFG